MEEGELGKFKEISSKIGASLKKIEALPIPQQTMYVTNGAAEDMSASGMIRIVVGYTELETRMRVALALDMLKDKVTKYAGAAPADGLERVIQAALTEKS